MDKKTLRRQQLKQKFKDFFFWHSIELVLGSLMGFYAIWGVLKIFKLI